MMFGTDAAVTSNSINSFIELLNNLDAARLRKIAVAIDEENRLLHPRFGGVADRVFEMSDLELITFIISETYKLNIQEINVNHLIRKHSSKIRFSEEQKKTNLKRSERKIALIDHSKDFAEFALQLKRDYLVEKNKVHN